MKTKSDVLKTRVALIVILLALAVIVFVIAAFEKITLGDCLIIMTLVIVGFLLDESLGFIVKRS